jgi:hypothetical protein
MQAQMLQIMQQTLVNMDLEYHEVHRYEKFLILIEISSVIPTGRRID